MPKDSKMKDSLKAIKAIPTDLLQYIEQEYIGRSADMPLERMAELSAVSKTMHDMFQPILNEAKLARPLLKAVVEGNLEQLINLVQDNPLLLFKKGQIKDPSGQVFYHVSAYEMIKYVCDNGMLAKVMPLVPDEIRDEGGVLLCDLKAIQKKQEQSLHYGGADLVKLSFDPANLVDFDLILQYTEESPEATFSLMENPEAILYYKDYNGKSHWYYANQETRTIDPIQPQPKTKEETELFIDLKKSLDAMENNSARRSNDAEHDIIAKTMNTRLVRNGIQYERDGKRYCDTRHDFNRYYNAYLECIRLYKTGKRDDCNKVLFEKIGGAQKEVMWLLQWYCEKNQPLSTLSDGNSPTLSRSLRVSGLFHFEKDVYSNGHFVDGFGSNFAILKFGGSTGGYIIDSWLSWGMKNRDALGLMLRNDLIAVNRLIEDAKTNVFEFKPEEVASQRPGIS